MEGFDLAPPGAIWYPIRESNQLSRVVLISPPPGQFGIVQHEGNAEGIMF